MSKDKYQEALDEILSYAYEGLDERVRGKDYIEAEVKLVQEAIDFRKPYKVTHIHHEWDGENHYILGLCRCRNKVFISDSFCVECGQALSFEDAK